MSESTDDMDAYIWVTDDVFHHIRTLSGDNAKIKKAQKILDRIFTRDLYKLIGEKKVEFVEKRMAGVIFIYKTFLTSHLYATQIKQYGIIYMYWKLQ